MTRKHFPLIALAVSLPLLALLLYGGRPDSAGAARLPQLTVLLVAEFGALLNAGALWLAVGHLLQERSARAAVIALACLLLMLSFALELARAWPL